MLLAFTCGQTSMGIKWLSLRGKWPWVPLLDLLAKFSYLKLPNVCPIIQACFPVDEKSPLEQVTLTQQH